jgi:signal transduction histidine kinase
LKYFLTILICCSGYLGSSAENGRIDSTEIIRLYDRCLDFAEDKVDSLYYYANFIKTESAKINFSRGELFFHRLSGIALEMQEKFDKALEHYLITLTISKKLNNYHYISAAYTDIAITYGTIKQLDKAKENFLISLEYHKKTKSISGLVSCLSNLGTVYSRLDDLDSAAYYLNESLRIGKPYDSLIDLNTTYNNLGNIYFKTKKYDQAVEHFRYGLQLDSSHIYLPAKWIAHLNLGYVFVELNQLDSSLFHINKAEQLANQLQSKSKLADIYALKASLEAKRGDYKRAYDYQKKWYEYDTASIRLETYNTILELQEKYNINEQIAENKLLQETIKTESFKNRTFIIYIIGLAIIIIVILSAFIYKRKANKELQLNNELMAKKNEQLAILNRQKNDLIGMVSHDLKTPFISIGMWSHILDSQSDNLSNDQQTAIKKILQSCGYGQQLIQRILDIEKNTGADNLHLEEIALLPMAHQVVESFKQKLSEKELEVNIQVVPENLKMISDVQIITRILENLLSNAIKFSYPKGKIELKFEETAGMIEIIVHDHGVGIPSDALPLLFDKHANKSTTGTNGEDGNGFGLTIVKRLVDELGGAITCQSTPENGTSFIIVIRK